MNRCILGVLLMLSTAVSYSQTAEEIISKHIQATGGAENWKNLRTLYMEGVTVLPDGNEVYSRIYKVNKKLLRREVRVENDTSTMIVNEKQGWYSNPETGQYDSMPQIAVRNLVPELEITGPLFNYKQKGFRVELAGKEMINNREVFRLNVQTDSLKEISYFIDTRSFYLIRESFRPDALSEVQYRPEDDPDAPIHIDYSDFKKIKGGLVFPFRVTSPAIGGSIQYQKIEANLPIDVEKLGSPDREKESVKPDSRQ